MDDLQKGLLLNSGGGGVDGGCKKKKKNEGDGDNSEGADSEGADSEGAEGADLAALTDFQYDSTGCGDFCMVICRLCGMCLCACCAAFSS